VLILPHLLTVAGKAGGQTWGMDAPRPPTVGDPRPHLPHSVIMPLLQGKPAGRPGTWTSRGLRLCAASRPRCGHSSPQSPGRCRPPPPCSPDPPPESPRPAQGPVYRAVSVITAVVKGEGGGGVLKVHALMGALERCWAGVTAGTGVQKRVTEEGVGACVDALSVRGLGKGQFETTAFAVRIHHQGVSILQERFF